MHLVHTGNSRSYLSDLVTTTTNIRSIIRFRSARTHRYEPLTTQLEVLFRMLGLALLALPLQYSFEITDSNIFKSKLEKFLKCLKTRSLHCDSFLPLVSKRWTAWIESNRIDELGYTIRLLQFGRCFWDGPWHAASSRYCYASYIACRV